MLEFSVVVLSSVVLVLQTVLCVKSNSRFVKWMPFSCCVLFSLLFFAVGNFLEDPMAGAGCWLVGTLFIFPIVCCGIGWMTASFINQHRENRDHSKQDGIRE